VIVFELHPVTICFHPRHTHHVIIHTVPYSRNLYLDFPFLPLGAKLFLIYKVSITKSCVFLQQILLCVRVYCEVQLLLEIGGGGHLIQLNNNSWMSNGGDIVQANGLNTKRSRVVHDDTTSVIVLMSCVIHLSLY